jgi:hypothetical protein
MKRWLDNQGGESLERYLGEHYGDPGRFSLSPNRYSAGHSSRGGGSSNLCFVATGTFRIAYAHDQFEIAAGHYCHLPHGKYHYEIPGSAECILWKVFITPERERVGYSWLARGDRSLDAFMAERYGDPTRLTFPARKRTPAMFLSGMCLVVHGDCRFIFNTAEFDLKRGHYRNLREGDYMVEAIGDEDCEVAIVPDRRERRVIDDQIMLAEVIEPAGGIERFRLVGYRDFKMAQYSDSKGAQYDLILEEEALADATVAFLERAGVPEVDWYSRRD